MLPDYLTTGLKVVFVGTAAGERSAARGHYYSGPGNRFWMLLGLSGITQGRVLLPELDSEVLGFGVGLTDVAKGVAASSDSKLRIGDYDVPSFLAKIEEFEPEWVAFNGVTAARVVARFFGESKPGLGSTQFSVGGASGFALPSSSGANNDPRRFAPKRSKDAWWIEFGDLVLGS